jgi:hypothetical protein
MAANATDAQRQMFRSLKEADIFLPLYINVFFAVPVPKLAV